MRTELSTLLLNPPSFEGFDGSAGSRYQARREIRSFWYPTWLAFPAGMIEGSLLVDASAQGLTEGQVIELAAGFRLLIMHTSTPAFENDAKLARSIKETYPSMTIGLVGPHVTVAPESSLRACPSADFAAVGEFDETVAEIAAGLPLDAVKGIAFRVGDGPGADIARTPARPLIADLDRLPFATAIYARDLQIDRYYNGYLKHPYISLYGGRGCRARCTYCLWPQTIGRGVYRVRSAGNIHEEMVQAKSLFPQVKEFFFDDDTFTDHPEIREIARNMGRLGITWSCNARANVPLGTLKVMKENGLRLLTVGFESGNQRVLNNMRKGLSIDGARAFARRAKDLGILLHGAFILGLPGETKETIEETMRFARELDPYSIQVSLAAPYPGTALYEQAGKEGWLTGSGDLVKEGIQNSIMSYPWLSADDIFEAVEVFYRRFYLRPAPILRILKEMLQDRDEFRRRIREGREFFSFMAKRREECAK